MPQDDLIVWIILGILTAATDTVMGRRRHSGKLGEQVRARRLNGARLIGGVPNLIIISAVADLLLWPIGLACCLHAWHKDWTTYQAERAAPQHASQQPLAQAAHPQTPTGGLTTPETARGDRRPRTGRNRDDTARTRHHPGPARHPRARPMRQLHTQRTPQPRLRQPRAPARTPTRPTPAKPGEYAG